MIKKCVLACLLMLTSCYELKPAYDYSFVLADGAWACDNWDIRGYYVRCEHVMSGKKSDRIFVGKDVSVLTVSEDTI